MSPVKRPSAVDGLRRAAAVPAPPAEITLPEQDPLEEHGFGQNAAPLVPYAQRPRPEKPVRFTLDLAREHHKFLKTYTADIEAKGASEVMRALLDELRDSPELSDRVRARIWEAKH